MESGSLVSRSAAVSIDIFIHEAVKVVAKLKNALKAIEILGDNPDHYKTVVGLQNQLLVVETLVADLERLTDPAYC